MNLDQPLATILFFAAILIFGGALFALVSLTKGGRRQLDMEKFRCKWLEIESALQKDDTSSHALCIIKADALLDAALRERGFAGKTMAERMKQMQGSWTNGNGVWAAHKLRNKIAHEPDEVSLDYVRARQALGAFKQALKDVGAI